MSDLEILSCNRDGERLEIICNQADSEYDYGGGMLTLQAGAASVADEGGREFSLDELDELATAYWESWEAASKARQSQRADEERNPD